MLWLKTFHIFFVISWFAGLFYLPRLFVYHVDTHDAPGIERFCTMERRLFGIMTIGAVLASIFGSAIIVTAPGYMQSGWLHAKLSLVALLIVYHFWCYRLMLAFRENLNRRSARWFRVFNEVPALLLFGVLVLVVLKPF
jgi:putative membrane protein